MELDVWIDGYSRQRKRSNDWDTLKERLEQYKECVFVGEIATMDQNYYWVKRVALFKCLYPPKDESKEDQGIY
jgi:hypothetical protein